MANGFQGPPAVDFYSQLSGLGDTLQANAALRQKQQILDARKGAFQDFTALDPSSPDYGRQALGVAQKLGVAGDQDGALKFLTLAQTAADRAHTAQREGVQDSHWNQSFGLQQRAADRADDPTPTNFVKDPTAPGGYKPIGPADPNYIENVAAAKARAASLLPPDNYEMNPDYGKVDGAPRLRPISGGPSDPNTIATQAEAKQGSGMGDGAVEIAARRLKQGDLSALTNIGRGAQASRDLGRIQNKLADILVKEDGLSTDDAAKRVSTAVQSFKASQTGQNAEARTGATREANLNLILKATDAAIPAALEASHEVSRTGFVPLNKIIQGGQVMTSDPALKKFAMANLQLAEHWARAMNPTGVMRESDRDKALSILSTADSEPTYKAMVNQLRTQITRERDAVRGSIPETPQFKGGSYSTVPAASSSKQPVVINGYTIKEN